MEFKDFYKILGVARDADADAIKKAYRRLARKYHPDVSKESDAEERFKELQQAYEVLSDPEKRQAYDRFGEHWKAGMEHGEAAAGGGYGPGAFYRQEDINPEEMAGFEDFISSIFGEGGLHRGASARRRGHDEHARLGISLEEAYSGATRTLSFDTVEADESGRLRSRVKTLNVTIPAGVTEGQRIRLAGQGQPGAAGAGDLYIQIHIQPHPDYTVSGRDLDLTVPITPWEAALGGKITVATLAGRIRLTVPPGSQTGKRLKLGGKGLPGRTPGDLFVTLKIVVPEPRTEADRKLYEQMAKAMPMNPREK
jgi:curved DNA-binding protein